MSKIHEALKKVQQQRLSTQATEGPLAPGELDPTTALREELVPNLAAHRAAISVPLHSHNSEELFRFEKLVAHCAKPQWTFDPELVFFTESSGSSAGAEQFRTLRTRLDKIKETKPLKKVQVTSAISGEGKTFVATNLAQAISRQPDRRVLLIDADLRRSMLHMRLGAPMTPGLSDYLLGQASETDVVQHGQEGNLFFIPGGTQVTDPSELLSSPRLEVLFDRMARLFDWIIVDSPPCLPLADSAAISALCDGVVMVVRAGCTPLAVACKAAQDLKEHNVLGVVLNALNEQEQYHRYQ